MDEIRKAMRLKLRKLWREYVADQCPHEKDRIRKERIDNIMHSVVLLEAMRRWKIESESRRTNLPH